jgi:hypothetical protein
MKERTLKEPKGKGSIPKKELKKAVKKVAQDKKDVATPNKDKKPAGGKNDKEHNSERPASGKADGKSRKK